jgi:hypothetical protein
MDDFKCKECGKIFQSRKSFSAHINQAHKITKEQYILKHFPDIRKTCIFCDGKVSFRGWCYQKYCSQKCAANHKTLTDTHPKYWKGKTQPKEMVDKRISNTDQIKKQQNLETSNMEKYGVSNVAQIDEVKQKSSDSRRGIKRKPRTKQHSDNITKAKIANGTNRHTDSAKNKIKKRLQEIFDSDDAPVTCAKSSNGRHVSGYYKNIYYRSSYELVFLEYCDKNNIIVTSAENKEFRVRYVASNGKNKFYYPDFYLPDYDIIVEIKPIGMLDVNDNNLKLNAGMTKHQLILLTEEELLNLDETFKYI